MCMINGLSIGILWSTPQVTSSIPQGSVLGTSLFFVYINDLVDNFDTRSSVRLFANGCLLFRQITTTRDQNEPDAVLNLITGWCERWDMVNNSKKKRFASL